MNEDLILSTLKKQLEYFNQNKYKSFDLCDVTSHQYFLKMNQWCYGKSFEKYIKYPHNILLDQFTPTLRKLYKVEKSDFAQSNAFIIRGLLCLFKHTKDDDFLKEAYSLIDRVLEQKSKGFDHACWGQPYDWFSKKIIPAYTPRTTVTSQVGRMFLDAYKTTNDSSFLDLARDIGDFFLEEMPLSVDDGDKTCFSYTTIDQHRVHNPNMMASGFLAMLSHFSKTDIYAERALTAANFTFGEMNEDGSWFYAKLPNDKKSKIDNYHTGYNIEAGTLLSKCLGNRFPFQEELKKSIAYYKENLFDSNGRPYLTNTKKFPTDIQCCAQSIITYSFLTDFDKDYNNQAIDLYKWTLNNMFEDGSYYYRIYKNGSKDKTDYIRWGDAWMFYAGSLLLTK